MAQDSLPPIPFNAQMLDRNGLITPIWSDWLKQVFVRVGGHLANSYGWVNEKIENGYLKLPNGFVLQWGKTASLASGSATAIPFLLEFPNACLHVIPGLRDMSGASTSDTGQWGTGEYTTTTFKLYNRTASAYVFNWFAIGY